MSNITSIEINNKKMDIGLIPSTTYTNLTIPTITDGSGEKRINYTAIDNGFYFIEFQANSYNGSNVGCSLGNITRRFESRSSILNPYDNHTALIQCLKGDSISVWFQNHVKVVTFRFIYAIGSEPKE